MGKINWGKVILMGLLAGLVMNIGEFILHMPVLGKAWEAVNDTHNLRPLSSVGIATMTVLIFILGIGALWLYAAIRPRYGAGPKTAICAGLAVWFFISFCGYVGGLIMRLYPINMAITAMVWELIFFPLATLLGAWLYTEKEG